ncbi:MAG: ribonuclease III [Lachnospiraceae bacterium]|nr:ribonuclease III [Lachnospiraceae bacterium]MBQ4300389.1 ribonuclease III [Lachnospiraceae bacterium]
MKTVREFQKTIGYEFKDENLLKQALTHSSYANEKRMKPLSDNERLEFLGDAVLEMVSSEFLYLNYPNLPEGDMTKLRASMVCEPTLAFCTQDIDLGDYVFLGKGEDQTGGRQRKSVLSDAMEAVIGAIFLDGGIEPAKKFILTFIMNDIEHKRMFFDSKTMLQEVAQGKYKSNTVYEIIGEEGPAHAKTFTVKVSIDGQELGTGNGNSKKSAEQQAAYNALMKLKSAKEL